MKQKVLILLMLTILTGSLLVGCGGNEATENSANVDNEVTIGNSTGDIVVIKPDVEYKEEEYYFIITDVADIDETYIDGTDIDSTNWEKVDKIIKVKEPIRLCSAKKGIIGYSKPDITCVYVCVNEEWSLIAFASELREDGLYQKGSAYVRTDELTAVMEDVEEVAEEKKMSAEAAAYLDEIRARAAQVNEERVVIKEEHPTADVPHIEEAESKDGLECFGNFSHKFGSADELEMTLIFFRTEVYDKYYIEYVDETDTSVEFNFYCTMQ